MKKHGYYFIIVALLFLTASFSLINPDDCAKIKNGKFYYYSKISGDKVEIERFDSMQFETNTKSGLVLKSKIIWKDDCNYEMYINALSNTKLEKMDSLFSVTPAFVEILSVDAAWYICRYKMKIYNKEIGGTDTMYFKN